MPPIVLGEVMWRGWGHVPRPLLCTCRISLTKTQRALYRWGDKCQDGNWLDHSSLMLRSPWDSGWDVCGCGIQASSPASCRCPVAQGLHSPANSDDAVVYLDVSAAKWSVWAWASELIFDWAAVFSLRACVNKGVHISAWTSPLGESAVSVEKEARNKSSDPRRAGGGGGRG